MNGVPACIGLTRCRLSQTVLHQRVEDQRHHREDDRRHQQHAEHGVAVAADATFARGRFGRRQPSLRHRLLGGVGDVLHRLVDGDLALGERC